MVPCSPGAADGEASLGVRGRRGQLLTGAEWAEDGGTTGFVHKGVSGHRGETR